MLNCKTPTNFSLRSAQTIINNCSEPSWEIDCQGPKAGAASQPALGPGERGEQNMGPLSGCENHPGRAS